jgi:hypothetical protein
MKINCNTFAKHIRVMGAFIFYVLGKYYVFRSCLVRLYFYLDGKRGDLAAFDEIVIRPAG